MYSYCVQAMQPSPVASLAISLLTLHMYWTEAGYKDSESLASV